MTLSVPSFCQIKGQIAAIRRKLPDAKVIGIHCDGRWSGAPIQQDGDNRFAIYQCESPLALRLALREAVPSDTTKVLLTSLGDEEVSSDIRLRLAKQRLFHLDPWQIVRSLFNASSIDPRLAGQTWIAETLLDSLPADGYPPVPGGFLDAETVWTLLLGQVVGMRAESLDLAGLLHWSLDPVATSSFRRASDAFRTGAIDWVSDKVGRAGRVILECIVRWDKSDVLPVGLACGVVLHPSAAGRLEKATGKLEERFLSGAPLETEIADRWSTAATVVVRRVLGTDAKLYRQILQRADEILAEIQADAFAHLSDTSPQGFDQRLRFVGQSLSLVVDQPSGDLLVRLNEACNSARQHDHAAREQRRLERVEMGLRLVRWNLAQQHSPMIEPSSFGEAAELHLHEGGFVDWARLSLRSGDPVRELSEAYAKLLEQVTKTREQQSKTFARLLVGWTAAGSKGSEVIPVERVLEQIVAPLAGQGLVLLIVIDGMSAAVCRELLVDVTRHDWTAIVEPGRNSNRAVIATIPSVTEFSRTSLLCGELRQGHAADEKAGFAAHPALLACSRAGSPPILFHKAGLQELEDSVLAAEVRKEIASTHRRVVGVVVNAVDDHLLKGEQIDTRWSRDEIKVLPALLHEARIARRKVVIVGDHGHVLDYRTEGRPNLGELSSGERWRPGNGAAGHDELVISGSRVVAGGQRVLVPWSERVRYGIKKNGYHGGANPQEMVVPVVVLASTDDYPEGWREQPFDNPAWWDESLDQIHSPAAVPLPVKAQKAPPGMLFDPVAEVLPAAEPVAASWPEWIAPLLASDVFLQQKQIGGRNLPGDDEFAKVLALLDARGGKMTSAALARGLEVSSLRLTGLLAKFQRVLNVDGYAVIGKDEASDSVELNRDLLLKQFDLM